MRILAMLLLSVGLCGVATGQTDKPYSYQLFTLGVTTYAEFNALVEQRRAESQKAGHFDVIAGCAPPTNGTRNCISMSGLDTAYQFVDDKLSSVRFFFNDAAYLDGYIAGLTEKFGEPKLTSATYQNGMGVSFPGRVWTWKNDVGGIIMEENGKSIGLGTLYYYDSKLNDEYKRRQPRPAI